MKNKIKKLISTLAICAVLFTILPIPNFISNLGGAAVCSDVPTDVRLPFPY
jgi:hypothetical protein